MKKLLLIFVFVLSANLVSAQDDAFRNDVKKLIEMTGSTSQIEVAKKQVVGMIPADKQKEFLKEFDESLKPVFKTMEDFYIENYTHQEVKEIIKFYETPVGKKITANAGALTEASLQSIQEWSMSLQSMIMKYAQ